MIERSINALNTFREAVRGRLQENFLRNCSRKSTFCALCKISAQPNLFLQLLGHQYPKNSLED